MSEFEYVGGGYWREKHVPRGQKAEILHGEQALATERQAREKAERLVEEWKAAHQQRQDEVLAAEARVKELEQEAQNARFEADEFGAHDKSLQTIVADMWAAIFRHRARADEAEEKKGAD